MKIKVLLLIFSSLLLLGCTRVSDLTYEEITAIFSHESKKSNVTRKGFKYYLPSGMSNVNHGDYYEILKANRNTYYLYVDMISYINKVENKYEIVDKSSYSKVLNNGEKYGYLEINLMENNQYLIEIMYNYAKIEVMVDNEEINQSLIYAVNILNSIEYNNSVINKLLSTDTLNYTEEEFNLFETGVDNTNTLEYVDEEEIIEEEQNEIIDTDYVKEEGM